MITPADIEKLLATRCATSAVLSLYLEVPSYQPSLRGLSDRADELISQAAQADRGEAGEACSAREQEEDRHIARRLLEIHAREWLGRNVAIFAGHQAHLAETVELPCHSGDRAVFAARPHVRPLLLALQRCPGYCLEVVGQQDAWMFGSWTAEREQRLVGQIGQAQDGLSATGFPACLAAVNAGAAGLLVVPESGLIPGFACQRCGSLSETGTDCPDWGAASAAVPDLIEEMAVRALHDGAQVVTVGELPGGIMARLRFPLPGEDSEPAWAAGRPAADALGCSRYSESAAAAG